MIISIVLNKQKKNKHGEKHHEGVITDNAKPDIMRLI
jgi:hypothetical protein